MFLDHKDAYPNSVVVYCWFPTYDLREMFGYLREKEDTIKRDLIRYVGTVMEQRLRSKLEEVEAQLIWMATNCQTTPRPPPRKRNKKRKGMPVQLSLEGLFHESAD